MTLSRDKAVHERVPGLIHAAEPAAAEFGGDVILAQDQLLAAAGDELLR